MREDFAVFILSHKRAENVLTLKTLKKQGFTGKWYLILDSLDDSISEYVKRYDKKRIIVFDKEKAALNTDTIDNFHKLNIVVHARNECWKIAEKLRVKYFLVLDDDYNSFSYRFVTATGGGG